MTIQEKLEALTPVLADFSMRAAIDGDKIIVTDRKQRKCAVIDETGVAPVMLGRQTLFGSVAVRAVKEVIGK